MSGDAQINGFLERHGLKLVPIETVEGTEPIDVLRCDPVDNVPIVGKIGLELTMILNPPPSGCSAHEAATFTGHVLQEVSRLLIERLGHDGSRYVMILTERRDAE